MTDLQIKDLAPADVIEMTFNGRKVQYLILAIVTKGTCINERSKAFGHGYAMIKSWHGRTSTIDFAIESDEYEAGSGYPVFDNDGTRIRGYELITDEVERWQPHILKDLRDLLRDGNSIVFDGQPIPEAFIIRYQQATRDMNLEQYAQA